jgi:Avidin family
LIAVSPDATWDEGETIDTGFTMRRLLLAVAAVLSFQSAASAQLPGPSRWTSQHGSILQITSLSRGAFRGVFTNRNPAIGCVGTPYPVTGTNFSVQITFTVNFVKCGLTVKWQGNVQGLGMSTPWWVLTSTKGAAPSASSGFDFFGRS